MLRQCEAIAFFPPAWFELGVPMDDYREADESRRELNLRVGAWLRGQADGDVGVVAQSGSRRGQGWFRWLRRKR